MKTAEAITHTTCKSCTISKAVPNEPFSVLNKLLKPTTTKAMPITIATYPNSRGSNLEVNKTIPREIISIGAGTKRKV